MIKLELQKFGGRGASSGGGGGGAKHPTVSDLDSVIPGMGQLNGWSAKNQARTDWIKSVMPGISDKDADATRQAAYDYSGSAYSAMHNETGRAEEVKLVNALIDNPNTPVYGKETWRGLRISNSDESSLVEQLNKGIWTEPGMTSFSAKKSVATKSFGNTDSTSTNFSSVIIHNTTATKGMPFKHLSGLPHENEVLQSASTMKKGMRILKYEVTTNSYGHKTYWVDVADN